MTGRHWGKAGVRLTDAEARRNDQNRRAHGAAKALSEQRAYRDWAEGQMVPARITTALDLHGLQGPEVDEACGAKEPDVDMWEAGTLYPTWEQVLLLAKLCEVTPGMFMSPVAGLLPEQTSLRFHKIGGQRVDYRTPPPVRSFTPEAIAARKDR